MATSAGGDGSDQRRHEGSDHGHQYDEGNESAHSHGGEPTAAAARVGPWPRPPCSRWVCLTSAGLPPSWRLNRVLQAHPRTALLLPAIAMALLVIVVSVRPTPLGGGRPWRFEENTVDVATILGIALLANVMRTDWLCLASRLRHRAVTDVLEVAFIDDPFDHIVLGYPQALRLALVRAVGDQGRLHLWAQRAHRPSGGGARPADGPAHGSSWRRAPLPSARLRRSSSTTTSGWMAAATRRG